MSEPFYITTPIYYVNDHPHIGHAYTSIAADVLARYNRLAGKTVYFLTGTDEHGQKIEKTALSKGLSPQNFVDQVAPYFKELTPSLGLSNDDFIRTTETRHSKAVLAFWKKLEDAGYIYRGIYAGWYAVRDEAYYTESELVDGKAPTGAPVEWVEEPSYFFALSKFAEPLLEFYKKHPEFIWPKSRYNEVVSFVSQGLKDLSISRTSFSWGIKLPHDNAHVVYVWLDALTNYISALGYPDTDSTKWSLWHGATHLIGKDILRFHAIFWPAFLMAADLPLPKRIIAHGWWTNEGQKISKSLGNTIDAQKLVSEYGQEQTRYFLMREVPFGQDGNFSHQNMISRINSELANKLGNLAQRTLSMVHKNLGGEVPTVKYHSGDLMKHIEALPARVHTAMNEPDFSQALEEIMACVDIANAYIDHQAPWALRKTDMAKMASVLYHLLEALRYIGVLLSPFTPKAMESLLDQLQIPQELRTLASLTPEHRLVGGVKLPPPHALFPRYNTMPDGVA